MNVLTQSELKSLRQVPLEEEEARRILKRNTILLEQLDNLPCTIDTLEALFDDCNEFVEWGNTETYNRRRKAFTNHIGCPHCIQPCVDCAWVEYYRDPEDGQLTRDVGLQYEDSEDDPMEQCKDATFGGVSLQDVMDQMYVYLHYFAQKEQLILDQRTYPIDENMVACIEEDVRNIRTFLQGHIEWAEDALELMSV